MILCFILAISIALAVIYLLATNSSSHPAQARADTISAEIQSDDVREDLVSSSPQVRRRAHHA